MTLKIAASGKGGVGKTTICALLVRYFSEAGKGPVLAVDADPNSCLGEILGMEPQKQISQLREEAKEPGKIPSGVPKARMVENWLNEIVQEGKGFDLLTMGRGEGPGCYCYINNLLRQFLSRLKKAYPVVIIDNEAGMEHLSRLTTDDIDCLIAVAEPSVPSVRTIGRILELADTLPSRIARKALIFNKAVNGTVPEIVQAQAKDLPVSLSLGFSHKQALAELNERGGSIFELSKDSMDDPQLEKLVEWCLSGNSH